MAATDGIKLRDVVKKLDTFAPLELADSWDNVGLLLASNQDQLIKKIHICIDLTDSVLKETVQRDNSEGNTMLICYHPPIFSAFKRLVPNSWKDKLLLSALDNKIPLYSPHTCLDAVKGGINDWLSEGMGEGTVSVIEPFSKQQYAHEVTVRTQSDQDAQLSELYKLLNSHEGTMVQVFSERTDTKHDGKEVVFGVTKNGLVKILNLIDEQFNQHNWLINVKALEKRPVSGTGQGRLITLKEKTKLSTLIQKIKTNLNLKYLRLATTQDPENVEVKTIAVCAGAGFTVVKGVSVDLYFTGEARHHDALELAQKGKHVLLCEHSHTERPYLSVYKQKLDQIFEGQVQIEVSKVDTDPLVLIV
jgi:dinuclear metal center YbgI/SA1388 family protein